MSRQILQEAFYDGLSIAHKLDNFLDGFERKEIHLFSYFSAILFHYDGNLTNEWKYQFIISEERFPQSKDLDDAIERHIVSGAFEEKGNFLIITGRGTDEFNKFSRHSTNRKREHYIDAACSTSFLLPYKETKSALLEDPNLKKQLTFENQDWVSFSNEKLKEITSAIGAPVGELLIPAVSWIEYLLVNNDLKG